MKYKHLGLMLDCSRNAVMDKQAVFKMIDVMSKIGYNALELYTEDTYEVEGEPYFGYLRGKYSAAEIREIDDYARKKGIELIPCIQTLAHFTATCRLPAYKDYWDVPEILMVGEDKTYKFIDKLFSSVSKMFSSRNINIGMDEAHFVGLGKYLDKHGYRNRFDVLTEHLQKVAEIAEKYGFTAHMWSDMFFRLVNGGEYYGKGLEIPKEVTEKLPKNIELCYWDYYHADENDYDEMIKSHRAFNKNLWFAGGLWSWCSYAPYNSISLLHTKAAMKSVIKNNVQDVFFAMWGDQGKDCSFFALLPSIYAAKRYADGIFDDEIIKNEFFHEFGISFDDFMLLDLPNRIPSRMQGELLVNPCKALLFNDPLLGGCDFEVEKEGHIDWNGYAKKLFEAALKAKEYGYIFETLASLCRALEIKGELGVKTRKAYLAGDKAALKKLACDFDESAERIRVFHRKFRDLWLKENKPFGLEIQETRIGGVILRLESAKQRLLSYIEGKVDKLEELEETALPRSEENGMFWYKYTDIISTNVM